ncbi:hypothetical protein ACMAY6_13600 [Luminiphilus sp. nBUS_16]|uniref:hypothetical protein n=1 Tax=Luminiphilus sp. nBUS_16 TaxID=3395315 RepID=UPI003EB8E4C4
MNMMSRFLLVLLFLLLSTAVWSQHEHGQAHEHEHEHEQSVSENTADAASVTPATGRLTTTPEIEAALANGGTAVVADVLGVVCDFCAVAMNKIFGKQEEVTAVYVDLDTKALNLVFKPGASLDDEAIAALAVQAGYRISAVHRNAAVLGS